MSTCFLPTIIREASLGGFYVAYKSRFFLAGYWEEVSFTQKQAVITFGSLQAIVAVIGLVVWLGRNQWRFPPLSTFNDLNLYTYYVDAIHWVWLFWLGLVLATIPTTALSGITMGMTFFHAGAEALMFALRCRYLASTFYGHPKGGSAALLSVSILFFISSLLVMVTDDPIVKGAITLIPALLTDIGNLIVTPWLAYKKPDVFDRMPNIHTLFAYFHIAIFYLQAITACVVPLEITADLILITLAGNLLFMILYLFFLRVPVPSPLAPSLDSLV